MTEMQPVLGELHGDVMRQLFYRRMAELAKRYVEEAEHQEGYEYWDRFPVIEDVVSDFLMFAEVENDNGPDTQ